MAKGYPDFFGVPQWPMLGGATSEAGGGTVPHGDVLYPVSVADKGQLYFVRLILWNTSSVWDCDVIVDVDGVPLPTESFTKGAPKRNLSNVAYSLYLTLIDYANNKAELTFIGPVPFTESYKVYIINNGVADVECLCYTVYAAVSGGVTPT